MAHIIDMEIEELKKIIEAFNGKLEDIAVLSEVPRFRLKKYLSGDRKISNVTAARLRDALKLKKGGVVKSVKCKAPYCERKAATGYQGFCKKCFQKKEVLRKTVSPDSWIHLTRDVFEKCQAEADRRGKMEINEFINQILHNAYAAKWSI